MSALQDHYPFPRSWCPIVSGDMRISAGEATRRLLLPSRQILEEQLFRDAKHTHSGLPLNCD